MRYDGLAGPTIQDVISKSETQSHPELGRQLPDVGNLLPGGAAGDPLPPGPHVGVLLQNSLAVRLRDVVLCPTKRQQSLNVDSCGRRNATSLRRFYESLTALAIRARDQKMVYSLIRNLKPVRRS